MGPLHDDLGWSPGCGVCDVGGDDGFAIVFSRNVVSTSGYLASTWGRTSYYPVRQDRMFVSDANVWGVAYRGRDRLCKQNAVTACGTGDYSFLNGEIFYYISNIGCGTIQAFSKYAHTWSSTNINGIGVGRDGVSISWTSTDHNWDRGSGPSSAVTPC